MKKIIVLLSMMLCMTSIDAMAQQVHGIETKRVIYNGEEYTNRYNKSCTEYYGWEFTNYNSIPVSVSITLKYKGGDNDNIEATKDIILKSKESYIFKPYTLLSYDAFKVYGQDYNRSIKEFYVVYEAYKLE